MAKDIPTHLLTQITDIESPGEEIAWLEWKQTICFTVKQGTFLQESMPYKQTPWLAENISDSSHKKCAGFVTTYNKHAIEDLKSF